VVEDGQPVDGSFGLDDVVGHEQDGRAFVRERSNLGPQQPAAHRVDVVGGLVEDDQPARLDGGHAERNEPLDAAREAGAVRVAPLAEVQGIRSAELPALARARPSPPRSRPRVSIAWRGVRPSIGTCACGWIEQARRAKPGSATTSRSAILIEPPSGRINPTI
jgi:hypothetical protein